MLEARYDPSIVELDGKIYAIGGYGDNKTVLQSVERYTESNGWESVAPLRTARRGAAPVTFNGKIYIMGGFNGNCLKSVECYHPDLNTWTSCADMLYDYFSVAAHNGHIYVVGDYYFSCIVERYDPQRDTWSKICSLDDAFRGSRACASFDNKLWTIGGSLLDGSTAVAVYNEANDSWEMKRPLAVGRIRSCFVVSLSLLTSIQ
ncbi:kelch-like protein 4 isoform X2 [Zeugodacus cucurbitae]|uniref:kelch-like protein 4 isoform X2 n=1 Tax=Zeugodacus cucurbitae TaxID=28588 RepID=UPI0023D9629D|nr:kelch-like protein 4 isoform X2 [Zeugodacus cucurbitae]